MRGDAGGAMRSEARGSVARRRSRLSAICASVLSRSRVERTKPVEPRDNQHVALVERVERAAKLRAIGLRTARRLAKDVGLADSGGAQSGNLSVVALAVSRNPRVAVKHA
jgi:hypothetical protein